MARYHFRDIEDQRAEHAHDVAQGEYRGQPEDFDDRPDMADLIDPKSRDSWLEFELGPTP